MSSRARWIGSAVAVLAAAGVLAAFTLRRDQSSDTAKNSNSAATEKASQKFEVEEALKDASLLDLIKNARVATRKGDQVTRTAMVAGLKKEPSRSKFLIQREITKAKDPTDQEILTRISTELP